MNLHDAIPQVWTEGDDDALHDEAKGIMLWLLEAYPGHPWWVRAYKGGFFIRNLDFPANWGMNCPKQGMIYSASAYKALVIRMTGEWLERANLKRGAGDIEQEIERVEGVPLKWQPVPYQLQHRPAPRIIIEQGGEFQRPERPT